MLEQHCVLAHCEDWMVATTSTMTRQTGNEHNQHRNVSIAVTTSKQRDRDRVTSSMSQSAKRLRDEASFPFTTSKHGYPTEHAALSESANQSVKSKTVPERRA